MIELNLVPDVKLEYIRAQRQRAAVISISILVSIVAGAVIVLMALYAFGAQALHKKLTDDAITTEYQTYSQRQDLSKTLTVQKQMEQLSSLHNSKLMSSRLFDLAQTIVPSGKNQVKISRLTVNSEDNQITIEAEAKNGYEALEVFKKTIERTKFEYQEAGERQEPVLVATNISDQDRRYSEGADGKRVLRFSLSFEYPSELFAPTSTSGKIVAPTRQNVTDSKLTVPSSLFTERGE